MRALAGGRGARAAADRGAQAAVQPPVEISRSGCVWLKLTAEAYPRLSLVRQLTDDGAAYLARSPPGGGRAGRRRRLRRAAAAPVHPQAVGPHDHAGLRAGRAGPMCRRRASTKISLDAYEAVAAGPFRTATAGDPGPVVRRLLARIDVLAGDQRYEEAAAVRVSPGRIAAGDDQDAAAGLAHRDCPRWSPPARRRPAGGSSPWSGYGRLAAAGQSPPRVHPQPTLDVVLATAETVLPGPGPTPCASPEETERILAWLERPETRLVRADIGWSSPASGALKWRAFLAHAESASSVHADSDFTTHRAFAHTQITDRRRVR